jgi:lipopolysaccharide transport system permease protein
MVQPEKRWDWEIKADAVDWRLNLDNLFSYRHLIRSMVRRDFLLSFQQTILGPFWLFVQPLLTLLIYVFVFGKLIGVNTGRQLPPVLFYYSGIILWNFFNESFSAVSKTFRDNSHIFSKVYFPRIIMPISAITTQLIRFLIQLSLLIPLILYSVLFKDFSFKPGLLLLGFPLAVIGVGLISLSAGLIFSVLTAKYRDLANLVELCIRLLFFITPILYPLSSINKDFQWIVNLNPLTPLFEFSRLSLFGEGSILPAQLAYTGIFLVIAALSGIALFNKQGRKLMDVI